MITIKMFLIEIASVVFTTVLHGSECVTQCEDYILSLNLFSDAGVMDGLINFQIAFDDITIKRIQRSLKNSYKKEEIEIVACGYFKHLLEAAKENTAIFNFDYPEHWCSNIVDEYRRTGYICRRTPREDQVRQCYDSIVPNLFNKIDYITENNQHRHDGKQIIIGILYENWTLTLTQAVNGYAFGYFKYVNVFVNNQSIGSTTFKSIWQYCDSEGNALLNQ